MIFGKLKLYAIISALLTAIGGLIYARGRKDNAVKEAAKDAREYKETTERIADAKPIDSNPSNSRDRLRERNKR